MKNHNLLPLLFCFVVAFLLQKNGYSQPNLIQKDSTDYFYNLLRTAKNSDDLLRVHRFYTSEKEKSYSEKDTLFIIYNLRYLASIERKLGQLEDSETTTVEALEFIKSLPKGEDKDESKIGVLNHLGAICTELEQYDRALEIYENAIKIAVNPVHINTIQNNIGHIYKLQERYDLAIPLLAKVYERKLLLKDSISIARSLNNLGYSQFKAGNRRDGLSNMMKALKTRINSDHLDGIGSSYLNLSEFYKDGGELNMALDYANKAYAIANSMNDSGDKVKSLSFILEIRSTDKVAEYKRLTDSISRSKKLAENKYASYKYNYAEEKSKADKAKLDLAEAKLLTINQEKIRLLFQISTFFVIIIGILLYFLLKSRHKKEKLKQVYYTEARISKKVHDEVANDMYLIMNKMQNKSEPIHKIIDDVEKIYFKTRDISKENSAIDLSHGFVMLLSDLLLTYKNEEINVLTNGLSKVNWDVISDIKKTIIYRVLQELMVNMKKHSSATIVAVTFNQNDKNTWIKYSDNGLGCDLKKSGGLVNVENRIDSINGSIIFTSKINEGFKTEITI